VIATETRTAPQTQTAGNRQPPAGRKKVAFGAIQPQGHRIVLYGPGGVGKTSLAAIAPGPVAFIDLDESMPVLRPQFAPDLDIRLVTGVSTWQDLRTALQSDGWDDIRTIVIDSVTKAEEFCGAWVLANIKKENQTRAERLEDYGYGKQFGYMYDTFLALLGDLDQHIRAGRNVILIAHDCTTEVPNPNGPNWLRYEPRLQAPGSGKSSIRLRVKEWADHVLYFGFDKGDVADGKMAKGFESRTIYPVEMPHCMAKSRTCSGTITVTKHDPSIWTSIIK
jgi:hypothetical protein